MKWAVKLSQYDPLYRPKTVIKSQALADFVAEFTPSAKEEKLVNKKKESLRADRTSPKPSQPRDMWQVRVDGVSNQKEAGAGVLIITLDGTLLEQAVTLDFPASNNEAEYEALLTGLLLAKELLIKPQWYKPVPNLPADVYHPQNSPWPFMQWAIDLVGPLPPVPAKKDMMIVVTDYITKWIEAEALSSTKEADVERFIWKNIICRFGYPQSLVTDNGSQFIGKRITAFFEKYKIKQHLSTSRYPQGNGQAKASNKVILDCLKKRLESAKGKWVE
ncbi:unnamed protein product [Prunus armeniaca]